MKTRILIADKQEVTRNCLISLIEKHPNLDVICEVDNGREAVELSRILNPDVVIIRISMQDSDGVEAIRKINSINPNIRVIVLSTHSEPEFVQGMLNAGATGYLCSHDELIEAINSVVRNKCYLSPA